MIYMNITLIGMPGCGKSTCGVLIAKMACLSFLDIDLLIQQNEGMKLQEIINTKGYNYFSNAEEQAIISLYTKNCVISTGGSAVYSEKAMNYLKSCSTIVYLKIDYNTMKNRIKNINTRGILLKENQTLLDMYIEREALYQKYADITISIDENDSIDSVVGRVLSKINKM